MRRTMLMFIFFWLSLIIANNNTSYGKDLNFFENNIGMKFIYIPPGKFDMGCNEGKRCANDEIRHGVTISHGFYLQITEVTQYQWKIIMGDNPSFFKDCGEYCPVESISWYDVQDFIRALNRIPESVIVFCHNCFFTFKGSVFDVARPDFGHTELVYPPEAPPSAL